MVEFLTSISHSLSICLWLINGNSNSPGSQAYMNEIHITFDSFDHATNVNVCCRSIVSTFHMRSLSLSYYPSLSLNHSLYFSVCLVLIDIYSVYVPLNTWTLSWTQIWKVSAISHLSRCESSENQNYSSFRVHSSNRE